MYSLDTLTATRYNSKRPHLDWPYHRRKTDNLPTHHVGGSISETANGDTNGNLQKAS